MYWLIQYIPEPESIINKGTSGFIRFHGKTILYLRLPIVSKHEIERPRLESWNSCWTLLHILNVNTPQSSSLIEDEGNWYSIIVLKIRFGKQIFTCLVSWGRCQKIYWLQFNTAWIQQGGLGIQFGNNLNRLSGTYVPSKRFDKFAQIDPKIKCPRVPSLSVTLCGGAIAIWAMPK